MEPVEVDASGLSCPQPVILTRQALKSHPQGQVVVLRIPRPPGTTLAGSPQREGCQVEVCGAPGGRFQTAARPMIYLDHAATSWQNRLLSPTR